MRTVRGPRCASGGGRGGSCFRGSPRPASRGGGGKTWQELTSIPGATCARDSPAPRTSGAPLLPPPSALRAPRPTAAEAAFQELSRNSPHVTAAPATASKRLERYCAGFRGGGRRALGSGAARGGCLGTRLTPTPTVLVSRGRAEHPGHHRPGFGG